MTARQRLGETRIGCAVFRAHRWCGEQHQITLCACRCHDAERVQRRIIEREINLYGDVLSRSMLDDPRLRDWATIVRAGKRFRATLAPNGYYYGGIVR